MRHLVLLLGLFTAAAPALADDGRSQSGQSNEAGIVVKWHVEQVADALSTISIETRDALSQSPVDYPAGGVIGYLQHKLPALVEERRSCADRVKLLATQGIGQKSDIDLNQYRVVTLNREGSLAFINPFIGINNAKLESITDLAGEPSDWVTDAVRMKAWILLRNPARLLEVDLQSRDITRAISLPADAVPTRLAFSAQSGKLWLTSPGGDTSYRIDTLAAVPSAVAVGTPGLTQLFVLTNGETAVWTNKHNELRQLSQASHHIALSGLVVFFGHSASSSQEIVVTADGLLSRFTASPVGLLAVPNPLQIDHTVTQATLVDNGRRIAAVGNGFLSVIDLATLQPIQKVPVVQGADALIATERFLYAIGGATGRMTMLALDDLRKGTAAGIEVLAASPRPATEPATPSYADDGRSASLAAVAPEGNGLLIASPRDGMVFQYMEGMMAPAGALSNYRRAAIGLAVIDYSLRRVGRGQFEASFRPAKSGRYELLLAGNSPRFSVCASLELAGRQQIAPQPRVEAKLVPTPNAAQMGTTIRVRLSEISPEGEVRSLEGLRDVELLVFDKRSGWQRRIRMTDDANGEYVAMPQLPRVATYEFLVWSASANLSFVEGSLGSWKTGGAQ